MTHAIDRSQLKPTRREHGSSEIPAPTGDGYADAQLRRLLSALLAFRDGNFAVRLPMDWQGPHAKVAEAFNQAVSMQECIAREIIRLNRTVGKEGRLKQRMSVPGAVGGWARKIDAFNTLLDDLVRPTMEISRTIGAVAKGDLSQSMELEVDGRPLKGEFLRSAKLVNAMIEQLAVVGRHLGLRTSNFVSKKPSNVRISINNILTFDGLLTSLWLQEWAASPSPPAESTKRLAR
jgi:hypothetical protein